VRVLLSANACRGTCISFLAGLHNVHPAYRMVNAVQAGGRL
jgi:hypothetical protein